MRSRLSEPRPVIVVLSLLLVIACSKPEPAVSEPAVSEPADESPAQTLGTVEGSLTGQETQAPLGDRFVVLCEVSEDPGCVLRPSLNATTDAAGSFAIGNVPPARYAILHAPYEEGIQSRLEDGLAIDPTRGEIRVLPGTMVDIGMEGNLENIRGAVEYTPAQLTFEFREGKLEVIEVPAGQTVEAVITASGL
ncbi:MAG TPA: hypothetical protein VM534_06875 [Thermoanaerobaculia bacterium]|nr:hypothetical protein [Thermoanaerobaculia bacterium]